MNDMLAASTAPNGVSITRDFTVATFVVDGSGVLLLFHGKLRMWLPPGGHIEPNELPDEAAVREVFEETGIQAQLVGDLGPDVQGGPRPLIRPAGVQLETIRPGHEHIDLIYYARPVPGTPRAPVPCAECERTGWYGADDWPALGVNDEVRAWCARAVAYVAGAETAALSDPAHGHAVYNGIARRIQEKT